MNQEARVDKWLWAARIFKTRSIAVAACKKGQVTMGGVALKPSRMAPSHRASRRRKAHPRGAGKHNTG